jgi:hypothetical protein
MWTLEAFLSDQRRKGLNLTLRDYLEDITMHQSPTNAKNPPAGTGCKVRIRAIDIDAAVCSVWW